MVVFPQPLGPITTRQDTFGFSIVWQLDLEFSENIEIIKRSSAICAAAKVESVMRHCENDKISQLHSKCTSQNTSIDFRGQVIRALGVLSMHTGETSLPNCANIWEEGKRN